MIVWFGPFSLDVTRRQLLRGGVAVHLTPKAFDLLHILVAEAPRVANKQELHERLWPGTFVSDSSLTGLVKELRRALDDRDASQPIIRTVNRVGYALACPLDRGGAPRITRAHWLVGQDRRFPLQQGDNLIGREPASAVCLDVASVSRRHARIAITQAGAQLEDLQSKNGTKVGEVMVASPVALQNGDRIRIGTVPLTYRTCAEGLSTETHASDVHVGVPASASHSRSDRYRHSKSDR
jgi:DNA-binding winged helix-turn-helix (wHTH) protein